MVNKKKEINKIWLVSADMGYGHQRAAYPLKDIAFERVINANSDKIISNEEQKTWTKAKLFYEVVSRLSEIPIIGKLGLIWIDSVQKIKPYYPLRSDPYPTYPVRYLNKKIKKGFSKGLIEYMRKEKIPMVTTFYIPALAANYYELPNSYCVICDADINRVWAPMKPEETYIKYFAPCQHAYNRLVMYGIPKNKIYLTGFPLPKECIGGVESPITKKALAQRLINLDPNKHFLQFHKHTIKKALGKNFDINKKPQPPTITFVIGGAGAQSDIPVKILRSLKNKLKLNEMKLCLVAGTHLDLKQQFLEIIKEIGLEECMGKNLTIICEMTKKEYFQKFNEQLNKTDILWTKPSELSFYAALGLPLILSPPIGAHEIYNKNWLHFIGAGIDQLNPNFSADWIEEGLANGFYARKALNGFLEAPRLGTYEIERIIFEK
ncbi:hypothetical protein K9L67_00340 [Candidatus Woesearchaeota archaeon]|nr:hypothetical protein [Candidatus Woesearchaeota archaeon]MCF7900655.1 hypothetical protein [Candidatus Woesearchaeota archaeon]MCF8013510.1 hypothetical protein [Candidatus Woesearchaeota archaeon]